jgi:hypothetical protein
MKRDPGQGVLAGCGGLHFAVPGWHQAADWCVASGRLWDRAHGPAGRTTGKLVRMCWRPRPPGPRGDSQAAGGFQEGEEVNSTQFRPQPGDGAFEFVICLSPSAVLDGRSVSQLPVVPASLSVICAPMPWNGLT